MHSGVIKSHNLYDMNPKKKITIKKNYNSTKKLQSLLHDSVF